MTLTSGWRLGPYEVLSALGAGGMGEVFRARDTKFIRTPKGILLKLEAARRKFDDRLHLVAVQAVIPLRMSSIFAPASRFSKIVATGMRVLRSTLNPVADVHRRGRAAACSLSILTTPTL